MGWLKVCFYSSRDLVCGWPSLSSRPRIGFFDLSKKVSLLPSFAPTRPELLRRNIRLVHLIGRINKEVDFHLSSLRCPKEVKWDMRPRPQTRNPELGIEERSDSETLLACSGQPISGSWLRQLSRSPEPTVRARTAVSPQRQRVCRRRNPAAGVARRSQARGSAPRPPPLPTGSAAPSAPRSAQTEQPPLQCQQPQRRRRRERQWPGPRGSHQRRTARQAHSATPRPPPRLRGAAGDSVRLGAALRLRASRSAAAHKGPRTPGVRGLRPGTGQEQQRLRVSTPPLPGRPEPSPEQTRHMTAATQRPASSGTTSSAAPRPPAPEVALAAPR